LDSIDARYAVGFQFQSQSKNSRKQNSSTKSKL
jgi:hypothetical protein